MHKLIGVLGVTATLSLLALTGTDARFSERNTTDQLGRWSRIEFGPKGAVPLGFYDLCVHGNDICRQTFRSRFATAANGSVRLTAAMLSQLDSVNRSVNRSIRPVSDGPKDKWRVGGKTGDCEDFALTKKEKLVASGWPSASLLIALGATKGGEEHAVLVIRTDRGDLVLDNLNPKIRGWSPALYLWSVIQSPNDTWVWYQLKGRLRETEQAHR